MVEDTYISQIVSALEPILAVEKLNNPEFCKACAWRGIVLYTRMALSKSLDHSDDEDFEPYASSAQQMMDELQEAGNFYWQHPKKG